MRGIARLMLLLLMLVVGFSQQARSLESVPTEMTEAISSEWRASVGELVRSLGEEDVESVLNASKMLTVLRGKETLAVVRIEGKRFCPRDDGLCLTIIARHEDKATELMFYAGSLVNSSDGDPQLGGAHFRPLWFYSHDLAIAVFNTARGLAVAPLKFTLPR